MRLILLLFLTCFIRCYTFAQGAFTLQGETDTIFNGSYIHIYGVDWSGLNPKISDSTRVVDGHFTFKGQLNTPGLLFSVFTSGEPRAMTQVYLEGHHMKLTLKGKRWHDKGNAVLTNSQSNADWQELRILTGSAERTLFAWYRYRDSLTALHPDSTFAAISDTLKRLQRQVVEIEKNWVTLHPRAYISLVKLSYSLFNDLTLENLQAMYTGLSPKLQTSAEGKALYKRINSREAIHPGAIAPELTARDTSGKIIALKDCRGRYVLLDFWASWCGPCLQQIPLVKKFRDTNQSKNLTIIGVSLDDDIENWKKAILQHGLNWKHVSDLVGWKGETGINYNIQFIPQNVLIGPDGRIIALNINLDKYTL
ncbi:TlpA disulfide reductase family protein [Chitinophaga eiseniae]|uniref:AhpC/TSA family protein n=1 Tax=Chitinophaga eiseniae TaxID=634771 RepID=A0A847SE59_9BACT|nr:TlpA disulfide reductase family protein [Chitinophaga eiseniae]NLR77245.1 AhpC/TSA family protein [Chitinophaga eiseniae]